MSDLKRSNRRLRRNRRSRLGRDGSAAVEFAFLALVVVTLAILAADFGILTANNAALSGATRIGAQYARDNATCQGAILGATCTQGIKDAMNAALGCSSCLTIPSAFPLTCWCDNPSGIPPTYSACPGTSPTFTPCGATGPNRLFITVSASQLVTNLVSWPGMPNSVAAATEIRLQ
jgi:Flp pilus assembly protein TadG